MSFNHKRFSVKTFEKSHRTSNKPFISVLLRTGSTSTEVEIKAQGDGVCLMIVHNSELLHFSLFI